ncbi:MAG: CHASE domain-containing protein [Candidatus Aquirickettsiella gammari]
MKPFAPKYKFSAIISLGTLILCSLATLFAWNTIKQREAEYIRTKFDLVASDILSGIKERLNQHEQILLSGAALFDAKREVSRGEWKTFVERLRLPERYPGILGVGYSQVIPAEKLLLHEQQVKKEGFPEYHIRPSGIRPVYTSILFLEPFTGRNLAAFGFDMASEATRAKAMWMAADSGETSISGKVKLVQENKGKTQAGFLMYVPIYQEGMPLNNPVQRRAALKGFSYSPYRIDDLMGGIFGSAINTADIQIYDESIASDTLMFDSAELDHRKVIFTSDLPTTTKVLRAYGHQWIIKIYHRSGTDETASKNLTDIILLLGCGLSVLMFFLVSNITRQRDIAMDLATKMTKEIREKNEDLRLSKERIELAMAGTTGGMWDWDITTDTVFYSQRFYELLFTNAIELGNTFQSFFAKVHPEDRAALQANLQKTFESKEPFDHTFRIQVTQTDRSSWRWFHAKGMMTFDQNGRVLRMAGILNDITERHQAEQMKSEFVSTVSHELRTPLTSITGTLSLAKGGALGEVPAKMQPMLETALKNCQRLGHLIDDLLDMEKLTAGKINMQITELKVMPLIEQAVETNKIYAERLHVLLKIMERVDDASINVDPERLGQILSNLISNAAKYSPTGDTVQISVMRFGGNVRISVIDHGSGIPTEFRHRIFQKFSQADSSDTRKKGGTGLGLAITKELVERMGGQIDFTSAPNTETCFFIDFPEVKPG